MVSEDDRALYLQNAEAHLERADEWVVNNVFPHLAGLSHSADPLGQPTLVYQTALTLYREQIAQAVLTFVGDDPKPEFWAYYADYDWVVLCQLYGRMIDLPSGWPMFCRDLKQWAVDLGNPKLPLQSSSEHHALADARWVRASWEFLAHCRDARVEAYHDATRLG